MSEEIAITFDEQNKIRVLDADKYRETEQLKIDSLEFIKKVLVLDEVVQNLNETLEEYAKKIEIEKLRAIGEVLGECTLAQQSRGRAGQQEEEAHGTVQHPQREEGGVRALPDRAGGAHEGGAGPANSDREAQ